MENKILFVDDDEFILTCFERLLGRRFNIETALGPDNAISALMGKGPFALVVSDMRMPGMSGIELLKIAKDVSPQTVGLVLTGNADVDGADEALRSGVVFKFVEKPCPPEELQRIIEEALTHREQNMRALI